MDKKEFNNILNECLERLLVKGETVEQCLQSYPEHASELKPLLETAIASKKALDIKPSAEFKARARYEFRAALAEAAPKRSRFSSVWLPRWATTVVLILGLLLAGGGTVAAANYSMPDSPLYPVKIATEQVQLGLARSDEDKAELHIQLADRRVAEIIYLADKGDAEKIEATTQRLDKRLESLAVLVAARKVAEAPKPVPTPAPAPVPTPVPAPTRSPKETTEATPKAPLPPTTKEALETQKTPMPAPPPALSEEVKGGKDAGADKDVRKRDDSRMKLKERVAKYAVNHPAILRAVLEKAPESSKSALRKAIDVLVDDYEKALKALD